MSQDHRDIATNAGWNAHEFLALVSHELRNATWPVLGWTEVISRRPDDAETLAQGIRVIKRSALLQVELINQLLDVSRISSGGIRPDIQSVALVSAIQEAIETMTPLARAKPVKLLAQLDGPTAVVRADRLQLERVFTNLLSNAIKFTPPGGRVQVWLKCGLNTRKSRSAILAVASARRSCPMCLTAITRKRQTRQDRRGWDLDSQSRDT
jgi:signal transduction histidine kinase